mgnify:CR=1 FL=1
MNVDENLIKIEVSESKKMNSIKKTTKPKRSICKLNKKGSWIEKEIE